MNTTDVADTAPATPKATGEKEMVVSRIINAPREKVFEAFTDPEHISEWWGPNGFTTTSRSQHRRVGGSWLYTMHGPDGTDYPNRQVFTEIVHPKRLCYNHDNGTNADPSSFKVTVSFEALGDKTNVELRSLFPSKEAVDDAKKFGAEEGGTQTLSRLDKFLASKDHK